MTAGEAAHSKLSHYHSHKLPRKGCAFATPELCLPLHKQTSSPIGERCSRGFIDMFSGLLEEKGNDISKWVGELGFVPRETVGESDWLTWGLGGSA